MRPFTRNRRRAALQISATVDGIDNVEAFLTYGLNQPETSSRLSSPSRSSQLNPSVDKLDVPQENLASTVSAEPHRAKHAESLHGVQDSDIARQPLSHTNPFKQDSRAQQEQERSREFCDKLRVSKQANHASVWKAKAPEAVGLSKSRWGTEDIFPRATPACLETSNITSRRTPVPHTDLIGEIASIDLITPDQWLAHLAVLHADARISDDDFLTEAEAEKVSAQQETLHNKRLSSLAPPPPPLPRSPDSLHSAITRFNALSLNDANGSATPPKQEEPTVVPCQPTAPIEVPAHVEGEVKINPWPKPQARAQRPAETRRVLLSNLPSSLTPEILTSIIFGGTIEQVQYKAGSLNGAVLFQTHQGCMAFFKEAANGLLVPTEDLEIAFVDLDEEVVPYSGESRVFLEKGYTRVVRAVGIGAEWTVEKLTKFAKQGRGSARALDHVRIAVNESGKRCADFRFMDIKTAFLFKAGLARDEDWEHCGLVFLEDPADRPSS